jgi:diguanylate cyclase (GGDEF)-like protein/PAS domain S-box-containing protein
MKRHRPIAFQLRASHQCSRTAAAARAAMHSGPTSEGNPNSTTADGADCSARDRRGLLIDAVTASVAASLRANCVAAVLPQVLARLAEVVHIDRMITVETLPRGSRPPALPVVLQWSLSGQASPQLQRLLQERCDDPVLLAWLQPLTHGGPVVTVRRTADEAVRQLMAQLGTMTSLIVPIMLDGRHWGRIVFENCADGHDWSDDDIKILTLVAEVIGAAITRERFVHQARQREQLLQAVTVSAAEIVTARDLPQAIASSLEIVGRSLNVDRMMLMEQSVSSTGAVQHALRNLWQAPEAAAPPAQGLQMMALHPEPDVAHWLAPLQLGSAVEGQLASARGGVGRLLARLGARSVLLLPVTVNTRYWGHIALNACRSERSWNGAEVDALRTLAELLGTAITRERHLAELARADTIIHNSPTVLYRLRGEATLPMIYVSPNVAQLGYDPAALLAAPTSYGELIHPQDREAVCAAMNALLRTEVPAASSEFRVLGRDGGTRWLENRYRSVRDAEGRVLEIEGILTDITQRKSAEQEIALLARADTLTGLANRAAFEERLRHAFAAAQRGAHAFAVLYLDLDRFKEVNDTLGHRAGDLLLQQVGRRLQGATREIDLVARLGGDEFALVQAEVGDPAAAGSMAEKLIEIVAAPYSLDGVDLRIGVSIGVALYAADSASPQALLEQADEALYRAKHGGRGQYRFHSEQIDQDTRGQLTLADELRAALARAELEIRYQPQVELASGRIVGMEALLRWNHPTRGLLLPEDFLPIAEKFGIMQQLGRWAVDNACRQMSLWRRAKMAVPLVAINISLSQIRMGREFVRDVADSIQRWELAPGDVELDVTEQILARTTLAQSSVLEELRRLGVGIAIDEFGAQYSSLDYLRAYRINRLKIARGMVAAADAEPGGGAMIRAILSLAAELGVEVVAEGVETETQRRLLVAASAQALGQGFYYSRAVSADDSMRMLRAGFLLPGQEARQP